MVGRHARPATRQRHRGLRPAHPGGVRYRVVAAAAPTPDAVTVPPSLEDGYLALRTDRAVPTG
ncbi:MAG TPA: hypothetical protein VGX25_35525 [Actinophytocola sp.]|nr:hypothetical protein [Actinophytocola sp.]